MNKIKISFLGNCDYANVLTEYSNVINKYSNKYESKVICMKKHPFNYILQHDYDLNEIKDKTPIKKWLEESEHIIFSEEMGYGDYNTLFFFIETFSLNIKNKKISVWHPGSNYRKSIKIFNENPITKTFYKRIYAIDLYRHSPKEKNDVTLLPFKEFNIKYDTYIQNFTNKLKNKTITHFPSNFKTKGTTDINNVIEHNSNLEYIFSKERIPNELVIREKNKSVFYVDQFNHYHSFGVASVEGMISGNIVLCGINNAIEGIKRYDSSVVIPIVNLGTTKESLKSVLLDTINKKDEELIKMIKKNYDFLNKCFYGPNVINNIEKNILNE